ncbi:MAG TPA: hypothetical protein VIK45_20920 [Candidatus Dormibacteraeota bacterium]
MNVTGDINQAASAGEGAALDPREAAKILEQAKMQARRQFDPQSALAAVVGAGVFLFGYGAVWWSMRDQHVYSGPAGWSLAVLYGLIAVSAIVGGVALSRANAGVSGKARRQRQAQAAALAAAGVGAWVIEGALRYRGVSFEIVYGVYGPTVPLIALAAVAAGINAMRESWLQLGVCIAIIGVASLSTFFGPLGAWGLTGLGCCLVLLAYAAALVVQQRRA